MSKNLGLAVLAAFMTASFVVTAHADTISIAMVPVGDPGNVADTSGYGAVAYNYQMGKYDVTLGQYATFLNAIAKTDTYELYYSGMATDSSTQGISRTGSPGSYSYSVVGSNPQAANCPVYDVSWGDAARFCNWLQNGQPTGAEGNGTTETGAYTLNGDMTSLLEPRNSGATYFLPSPDEWFKAAYYKGGGTNAGYWYYPTRSDTGPSNLLSSAGTNNANCAVYVAGSWTFSDPVNHLTPVGAFAASPGPYGTFDMGGDVYQWDESIDLSERGSPGGCWCMPAPGRPFDHQWNPVDQTLNSLGFRVASNAPEPGSITLLVAGAVGLLALAWRRRRAA